MDMKTETREIYKCEHCKKLYQIASYCIKHEVICHKNPENARLCLKCPFLEMKETTIYHDTGFGEISQEVKLFHCQKVDSYLYPPVVELKGNAIELGDDHNEPMKKECEHYKDFSLDFFGG